MKDPVARMDHLTDLHPYDTGKYAGVQVTLKSRDNCHVNSQVACHNGKSADQQDREQAYVESIVARLNAKKTMAEISIPGCRTIFGRNAHMVRRIVWCLILVACTLVCTFQVRFPSRYTSVTLQSPYKTAKKRLYVIYSLNNIHIFL